MLPWLSIWSKQATGEGVQAAPFSFARRRLFTSVRREHEWTMAVSTAPGTHVTVFQYALPTWPAHLHGTACDPVSSCSMDILRVASMMK